MAASLGRSWQKFDIMRLIRFSDETVHNWGNFCIKDQRSSELVCSSEKSIWIQIVILLEARLSDSMNSRKAMNIFTVIYFGTSFWRPGLWRIWGVVVVSGRTPSAPGPSRLPLRSSTDIARRVSSWILDWRSSPRSTPCRSSWQSGGTMYRSSRTSRTESPCRRETRALSPSHYGTGSYRRTRKSEASMTKKVSAPEITIFVQFWDCKSNQQPRGFKPWNLIFNINSSVFIF